MLKCGEAAAIVNSKPFKAKGKVYQFLDDWLLKYEWNHTKRITRLFKNIFKRNEVGYLYK